MKQQEDNTKKYLDLLVMSVTILATIAFPYIKYAYTKKSFTLTGIQLLTGQTVCGGKNLISVNIPMVIMTVASIILIVAGILTITKRKSIGIMALASIVHVVCNIYLASTIGSLLSKATKTNIGWGSLISLILGFAIVVRTLFILWRMKVISSLDFMAVPGMLYFIINNYIPMLGITIAFKKIDYSKGIFHSPWNGLDNFKQLFSTSSGKIFQSDAFIITRNTLLYNIAFIILGTFMGVVVGICLADLFSKGLQKFFQTSILLPQLISYVIVAYIVFALFSNDAGLINGILGDENAINFYSKTRYWPFILIFIYIWKMVGYNAIIFLASIVCIDKSIYEASRVDGASKWKQIRYVTLPMLKPTIMTLVLLNVGRIMYSDFGLFYQVPMDSGALYQVTNTIDTYVYRCLMTLNNISTSSAACTYQAIIGFILVLTVNLMVRKKDKESALF